MEVVTTIEHIRKKKFCKIMSMVRQEYSFKEGDTKIIRSLGYEFNGINQKDFSGFIKQNYPGFDLAHLLGQVEQLMALHPATPLTRIISVDQESFRVELFNRYTGEDDALIFDRIFYKKAGVIHVSHEYLVLPAQYRNQGLAMKVLKASLQQYINMGLKIVHVVAGLSIGAYVWARNGFVAVNRPEMDNILQRAKVRLPHYQFLAVLQVYDVYYDKYPKGSSFPIHQWADMEFMRVVLMDRKSQWEGRLNLANKKQLRKFEDYVSKEKT